ncbi:hypothetical protein EKO04_002092 [Ascochyta lentis]|uniref:Uncharacterized protein n=1 Tax=Ascochyta lentis TaxID=205686 RepID=A0A8H7J9M8_9PLEO|nr:hypothetical protein EKO04_002092 [Ascochyta lentis]
MAPPRLPTALRSPYKKALGNAAPPDPAPPTTRSTKRARLTAEDVELEDEEIKEAFDDVPADDQSGVPGPAQDIEDSKQSKYEAEVDEIKAYPSTAVVLAERTTVAAKKAVVQIKTLLTVNSTLLARFTYFKANLCTRLEIPPAAGHKDFV